LKPYFSIIIPAFNRAHFLKETLDSCLQQVFRQFEVIVVDDGSTDNTENVIEKYLEDKRFSYYYKKNEGRSIARNFGATVAKGEYLKFLDSDDVLLPEYLEKCYNYIETNQDVRFLHTGHFIKNEKENVFLAKKLNYQGNVYRKLWFRNDIALCTTVISADLFFEAGGFRPGLEAMEDWEFWIRISKKVPLHFIRENMAVYRQHSGNTLSDREKMNAGRLEALKFLGDVDAELLKRNEAFWLYLECGYSLTDKMHLQALKFLLRSIWMYPPILGLKGVYTMGIRIVLGM